MPLGYHLIEFEFATADVLVSEGRHREVREIVIDLHGQPVLDACPCGCRTPPRNLYPLAAAPELAVSVCHSRMGYVQREIADLLACAPHIVARRCIPLGLIQSEPAAILDETGIY